MLRKLLVHGAIVISAMYVVFFCIDRVNPAMAFIDNDITKVLILVLSLLSVINAGLWIREDRRRRWKQLKKLERMQAAEKAGRRRR